MAQSLSLTPSRYDLTVYRGDTLPLSWSMGYDITGKTFDLVVVVHATEAAVYTKAGVITDAMGGIHIETLTAEETAALDPAVTYRYEVKQYTGTDVLTLIWGLFNVQDNAGT